MQAEGTVDGHAFYFRARWESMSIRVASNKTLDPLDDENAWYSFEEYGDEPAAAGYAPKEDCIAFINKAAELWANEP